MTFYVIDTNERAVTWPAKDDAKHGEDFLTQKAAEKRAKERAFLEPGVVFAVVKTVAEVECPIGQAKITPK